MPRNRIVTELRADSAQLRSEFGRAQKSVKSFTGGVSDSTKKLIAFTAGAVGLRAGLGVFTELGEKFDRVGKLSNRFDLPVEEIQKISIAAELSGTNLERMTAALTKATVGGVEAGRGIKSYADAFADLRIDVEEFNRADATEKISLLSRAFAEAEDESLAFTAAYRILGKAGADLIPLLRENADGIERLSANLKTVSEEDVRAIESFNDEMSLLKANLQAELARAFADSLDDVRDDLLAVGKGAVQLTAFLVDNRKAIGLLVAAWAAYKGIKATAPLIAAAGAVIKNTIALKAETAAVAENTAAQVANASARRGLGLGQMTTALASSKAGFLGLASAIGFAGFKLGELGGEIIASRLDFGESLNEIDYSQGRKEREKELSISRELAASAEVERQNALYRNEIIRKQIKLEEEVARQRRHAREDLQGEINQIAKGVLETELGFKSQEEQLDAQKDKLETLRDRAREYAEAAGFQAPENLDSEKTIELARAAVGAGELEIAKGLLEFARGMQARKEKILGLERGIRSEAEATKKAAEDEAKRSATLKSSQEEALRQEAQMLTILKLKAAGKVKEAEALEKEIALRREAKILAERTGISEENALKLARQKKDLQAQADGDLGLDNRFNEDGSRKMARDGKRKKIVLIRRDANGNRIDSRAQAELQAKKAAAAAKANPLVNRTDRLIELAENQLRTWQSFQTSS